MNNVHDRTDEHGFDMKGGAISYILYGILVIYLQASNRLLKRVEPKEILRFFSVLPITYYFI